MNQRRKRKEYHLKEANLRPIHTMTLRTAVIFKYRAIKDHYKRVRLYKQFFKIMELARENNQIMTFGEMIAVLREKLNTSQPTSGEIRRLKQIVYYFRRMLGALSGILAYQFRYDLKKGNGPEPVFRPIQSKREYMDIVGKHMENVKESIEDRHTENLELLKMTPRQIENMIREASAEIDIAAEFGEDEDKRKRKRKGKKK
jgi:hypothetical protein